MTPEDFRTRWLTIGTDSKAVGSSLPPLARPVGLAERRQMGEKGIGRLAIASIGSQLLIVSRALETFGTDRDCLVVALLQWSIFEVPGLTLDDVIIPLRIVKDIDEVDKVMLMSMKEELSTDLKELAERIAPEHLARVEVELQDLDFDPSKYLKLNGPSPARTPGTAFIVRPVTDDVDAVMEIDDIAPDEYSVSMFQRFLLGFINTITPSDQTPDFVTEFIRHDVSGFKDVIDPSTYFWESDDFKLTDHTVEGSFDEYGTFEGRVLIYGKDPVVVREPWAASKGNRSSCGPFKIKFGYVQGQSSESKLPPEDFALMTRRLEKIGGLYVYRDGIRVLPYGNSENDYLDIEKRRTLNAGKYYFSYRRMFGAIDIDSRANWQLQEKAGREGFRENRAYRDFREILKGFLVQLAANFFSTDSSSGEWQNERERLRLNSSARVGRSKVEKRARERFSVLISERLNYIESGRLGDDLSKLVSEAALRLADDDIRNRPNAAGDFESYSLKRLDSIRETATLVKPVEMALTAELEREWKSLRNLRPVAVEALQRAAESLQRLMDARISELGGLEETRSAQLERVNRVNAVADAERSEITSKANQISTTAAEASDLLVAAARNEVLEFDRYLSQSLATGDGLTFAREVEISASIQDDARRRLSNLELLQTQASSLVDVESSTRDMLELKELVLDLQEQIDSNLELLQLGQAVQIVSHEFEASIRSVRSGLQNLAPWARSTPRLQPIVRDLKASFAHLDGYLRLFTPLQRRLYRDSVIISGREVESFVTGVFEERLSRHQISLRVSSSFREWEFRGYPSTFYPVFVNLIDNAIYWIASNSDGARRITLDADDQSLLVTDTGPGVRPRDSEAIFERGFGRRRGGRGLGLSLARELLERDGWQLHLVPSTIGASFRLVPTTYGDSK